MSFQLVRKVLVHVPRRGHAKATTFLEFGHLPFIVGF